MSGSVPTHDPRRVRAVVLDWAGTTIDHGSRAPVIAITRAMAARGVDITEAAARGPMGMGKRDHIGILLRLPEITQQWQAVTGSVPDDRDRDEVYEAFQGVQLEAIGSTSDVIRGVPEAIARLRRQGIAIGSTTGYFRAAALAAASIAAGQGFVPDVLVAADDVPAARPSPWMMFRVMETLDVFPPLTVVKVGDTPVDMGEGRNAGTWSVGVTETGNELALTAAQLEALSPDERAGRAAAAGDRLLAAGAHILIPSVAQLPAAIDQIEARLSAGERP